MFFTTFEEYLCSEIAKGIIDFRLRVHINQEGEVVFYIHPLGKDGRTVDFTVLDNTIEIIHNSFRVMIETE